MTKFVGALALIALSTAACSPQDIAIEKARQNAANRSAYVATNSLDYNNYDRRQRLSDNPSTIIWCTGFPSNPNAPMITVPIVGKLTSSGKSPFPKDDTRAGPDGMYGPSSEFRYGFTPGGNEFEFTGMATVCTNEPTVWQKEKTILVIETDTALHEASKKAEAYLKSDTAAGRAQATAILTGAAGAPK